MNVSYCLPIKAKTKLEVYDIIDKNTDYFFYEIWLDYIEKADLKFTSGLLNKYKNKNFIFLFRRLNFEKTLMDTDVKKSIISSSVNQSAFVDFDINDQISELEFVNENNIKINKIISYHNYKETPDEEGLINIINYMNKFEPEVVKIATKCNNRSDALRLMTLIHILKGKKSKFIVTGMGKEGKIVRVYGLINGNFVNFAPNDTGRNTADGQILKKDLQTIVEIFDNK